MTKFAVARTRQCRQSHLEGSSNRFWIKKKAQNVLLITVNNLGRQMLLIVYKQSERLTLLEHQQNMKDGPRGFVRTVLFEST